MEKVIKFFIQNRYFTHFLFGVIILLAILAYRSVPKEIFPPASLDKIMIRGSYAGASPTTLDKMAVSKIEDELEGIEEIGTVETIIRNGSFQIIADLKPGVDQLNTLIEVKGILSRLKRDLPSDMTEPSAFLLKKVFPLMFVSIASNQLNREQLLAIADDLKGKIAQLGDLQVKIRGDSDQVVYFYFDTQKLDSMGLGKNGLVGILKTISTIYPVGKIEGSKFYFISFKSQSVEEFKNSFIKIGGKIVRIGDIVKVKKKYATPPEIGKFNGVSNIILDIKKGETGDAVTYSRQIRHLLNNYRKSHPQIVFGISTDTSKWVRNRFNTVVSNILTGMILLFLILRFFLNSRLSIVILVGIPTSFAISLIFLDYFGYSLNLLSLLGALIALGMIVDEAIVVGENIYRHLEMGKNPVEAAVAGTREVFLPVLGSALTTILAFIPLLMIKGEIGIFIKILPIMITILVLSSLLEALVFLPLHSTEVLKIEQSKWREQFWERVRRGYQKGLKWLFRWKWIGLGFFLVIVPVVTFWGMKHSKFQLFPDFDVTQIYISGKFENNYTLEKTAEGIVPIENLLKPLLKTDVAGFTTVIGMIMNKKGEMEAGENYFHIFVDLKELKPTDPYNRFIAPLFQPLKGDKPERTKTAREIKSIIEKRLKKLSIPGLRVINVLIPQAGIVKGDVVLGVGGKPSGEIVKVINWLEREFKKIPGIATIYDDAELGADEVKIFINNYGRQLGITPGYLYSQLRGAFGEGEIGKDFTKTDYLKLILEATDKDRFSTLTNFQVETPTGQLVTLSQIARFSIVKQFKKIHKYDGDALKSIYITLDKRVITTDQFLNKIAPLLEKLKKDGIKIKIGGAKKVNKEFMGDLIKSAVVALTLILLVLILMFNSFRLPFAILSVIFLSMLGVLIGNWIIGLNMTMLTRIGIVGLAGVVVNDGIVMLDFLKRAKSIGEMVELASHRLRPIVLTSVTTFFGFFTLIFFPFGQAKILQPLAVTLGFGLLWATILNLFYLPLLFYLINRKQFMETEKGNGKKLGVKKE